MQLYSKYNSLRVQIYLVDNFDNIYIYFNIFKIIINLIIFYNFVITEWKNKK